MLLIDQKQNGGEIAVSVGEKFGVELPENPTTGYRWKLQSPGDPALQVLEEVFEPSSSTYGSGGARRWTLAAERSAVAILRAELGRSWQTQAIQTFSLTVQVKAE